MRCLNEQGAEVFVASFRKPSEFCFATRRVLFGNKTKPGGKIPPLFESTTIANGTNNGTTPAFTVEAPWILDWRLYGDYDQLVALEVTLVEAKTGRHVGQVVSTKRKGNGVRLFRQGGTYQLRVSGSLARWTIKIQQLTPEEAELYTPR